MELSWLIIHPACLSLTLSSWSPKQSLTRVYEHSMTTWMCRHLTVYKPFTPVSYLKLTTSLLGMHTCLMFHKGYEAPNLPVQDRGCGSSWAAGRIGVAPQPHSQRFLLYFVHHNKQFSLVLSRAGEFEPHVLSEVGFALA